mmetsp:Transcript_1617/g.4712  ORF Transcript_1617/g.4712 Transcript_1617/m.4712 type:complete len:229 (+) Transcript_1617:827-1513(+)
MTSSCCSLPFSFARQSLPLPSAVLGGIPMRYMDHGMILSVLIGRPRSLRCAPIRTIDGHPVLRLGVDIGRFQHLRLGQERLEDKGPTELLGLGLIIRGTDKFREFFVGNWGFVHKEGVDTHNLGRDDAAVQRMNIDVSKGLGTAIGIDLAMPPFLEHFFSRPGPMRPIGDISHNVGPIPFVMQIFLFNVSMGLIKGRSKDVFDAVVNVGAQPTFCVGAFAIATISSSL